MDTEVPKTPELTPEQWREMSGRFAGRRGFEDDQDESESSREETMTDVFGQMRANKVKTAPADPAIEAARRKVAQMERTGASIAELMELSEKAGKGDRSAKERVFAILDGDSELCSEMADISRCSESLLLEAISGGIFAYQAALVRRADAMRREMLAQHSSPLERTAVENVILAWWQLQFVNARFAVAAQRDARLGALLKMQERAAKGYQNSLKSLELASKASQALSRSNSSAAAATQATPSAAAATKAKAGKRTRSKPAKPKPYSTSTDKPSKECNEQPHCDMPVRPPTGPIRTTRKPANRVARFVGTNGAPPNSNGHAIPEPVVGVLDGK